MVSDDELSDALRAALDDVADGHRPAWRYLSKILTRIWSPPRLGSPEPSWAAKPKAKPKARVLENTNPALGRFRFGPETLYRGRLRYH